MINYKKKIASIFPSGKKCTRIFILLFVFCGLNSFSQNSCSSPKIIDFNSTSLTAGWYYFKALGDKLQLDFNTKNNPDFHYHLYEKSNSCSDITEGKAKILLTNEQSETITPAMLEEAKNSGRCLCESCLKKFYPSNKEIKVRVNSYYLLHIEGNATVDLSIINQAPKITPPTKDSVIVPEKKTSFSFTDDVKNLDSGQVYILKHVRFVAEKADFLNYSGVEELNGLAQFLVKNPTVKISINGHVNGPGIPNNNYYQTLSEDRCHAVYMFLMKKGINGRRMNTKGFGNTQMIFPAPTNEPEAEANRRVEIVIIAK